MMHLPQLGSMLVTLMSNAFLTRCIISWLGLINLPRAHTIIFFIIRDVGIVGTEFSNSSVL